MLATVCSKPLNLLTVQTEEDYKNSEKTWNSIGRYMQAKYDADKNLVQRTAFKWTILRPRHLTHEPGTGRATVGKAPLGSAISVSLHRAQPWVVANT
jgi:hypothetical protein